MSWIPFNSAAIAGAEFDYMQQALESRHISGDGAFTRRCHALLEQALGVPKALLTTNRDIVHMNAVEPDGENAVLISLRRRRRRRASRA